MKTTRILGIDFIAGLMFGCKGQGNEDVADLIEDTTVSRLSNESDEYFSEALASLDKEDNAEAATHLEKGISELKKEGKEVSGLYKKNLDKAIDVLNKIEADLKNGKKVSMNALREIIANAEIKVVHNYLLTSDFYLLDEPEEVFSNRAQRRFEHSFSNLKAREGKMKPEIKNEGDALVKEGKNLDKEYKDWEEKVVEYNKKANEHLKKNYPDLYEQNYWVY